MSDPNTASVGFIRRLSAMTYDALCLAGLNMAATALVLPLSGGEAIAPGNPLYAGWLFLVTGGYFILFWTRNGQTPGMRAWKLVVQRLDGRPLTPWHALLRFVTAFPSWLLCGAGLLWSRFDRDGLYAHERFSETRVVRADS